MARLRLLPHRRDARRVTRRPHLRTTSKMAPCRGWPGTRAASLGAAAVSEQLQCGQETGGHEAQHRHYRIPAISGVPAGAHTADSAWPSVVKQPRRASRRATTAGWCVVSTAAHEHVGLRKARRARSPRLGAGSRELRYPGTMVKPWASRDPGLTTE